MFTDMVGSTASAQDNEAEALRLQDEQAGLVRPLFAAHQGREIKSMGDGFLAEFDSALRAVQCAIDIQQHLHDRNSQPGITAIQLRIGIHLGDVEQRESDIFGDAVNIAARIEPLAPPGGLCISGQVFDQVRNKIPNRVEKLESRALKGVRVPLDVFRVALPWTSKELLSGDDRSTGLAVLPFANISPDPKDGYFADGLTEELITVLSQLQEIPVIARTSVMQYKATTKDVSQIGTELGVSTILEGSVRKAGNRLRISVQLIDAASQRHLWANSYDRELTDIFMVQTEIANQVADALRVKLRATEERHLEASLTVPALKDSRDIQAYLYFLQGQALVYRQEEAPLRQALRFFEQASERDPSFSRAHAGTALGYIRLGDGGYIPFSEAIDRGRTAAEKALSISPDLAEAHSMLAALSWMADDPFELGEKEARKAIELNPNLAEPHFFLGMIGAVRGDLKAFVSHTEAAYQLDPLSVFNVWDLGRAYFYAGRGEDALEHWKRDLPFHPIASYRGMIDYYIAKGDLEKAGNIVEEMEKIGPTDQFTYLNRGYLAALLGDRATATEMIANLVAMHEQGRVGVAWAGYIYLALGDLDKFFEYMFAAARDHTCPAVDLVCAPLFAEVRKDSRFPQLLESIGLRIRPTS